MAMDEDLWEEVAADRGAWRQQAVYYGLATHAEQRAKAEGRKGGIKHPRNNNPCRSYVKDAKGTDNRESGDTVTASAAPQ